MEEQEQKGNNTFDLIHHPFPISLVEESGISKTERGYSLQFGSGFSKTVDAEVQKGNKNFIVLEVDNDACRLVCETSTLYRFNTPADFFVPVSRESADFYADLFDNVQLDEPDALRRYAADLDKIVSDGGFPEYPLPLISTARHFSQFYTEVEKSKVIDRVYCKRIQFGDKVPASPDGDSARIIRCRIGEMGYEVQERFLKQLFSEKPIWRYLEVEERYANTLGEKEREELKRWHLKTCLTLHAFFYTSGPWRSMWVRYAYNPEEERENYKYQLVAFERGKPFLQLFQVPSVVEEVSKQPESYLRKDCDPIHGFFSESLKNLILLTLNKGEKIGL